MQTLKLYNQQPNLETDYVRYVYVTGKYRKVKPKPKPNQECRALFNLPKQNM